jgi:hypothetical protein
MEHKKVIMETLDKELENAVKILIVSEISVRTADTMTMKYPKGEWGGEYAKAKKLKELAEAKIRNIRNLMVSVKKGEFVV